MTGRYAFTVSVRGLRPQTVYGRHAVPAGLASNVTQTVLARVAAVLPSRSRGSRTVGG